MIFSLSSKPHQEVRLQMQDSKKNVGPPYSIISFLKKYERIIETIDRAENLEDHYSNQKRPKKLLFGYTFEKQAHELYNKNIYKKF